MEHPENSEEYKGLTVNKGIEQPSIVNPYLKLRKKPRRREFSVGEYVEGIVKGDRIESGGYFGGECKTGTSGYCPGSDREVFALFRKFYANRYQWCARCRQEYIY